MDYSTLKDNSLSQTTLEICLVLAVGILLLIGAISVWNYFCKIKVERMDNYRATRLVALDLRSSNTGQQVDYEPPPLDIFSLAANVADAPDPEEIEDYPEGSCDTEFNELMELSGPLLTDVGVLSQDFTTLMIDSTSQRTDLGMLRIWYVFWGNPLWFETNSFVMTWLYADDEDFFLNDWDTIEVDFDDKVNTTLASPNYIVNIRFEQEPDVFYFANEVRDNFITPGKDIESQMETVNLERLIKQGLPPLISKVAEAKFNACIREVEGEDTTCDQQCGSFLDQAETEINESIDEANSGQLPESHASFQEVIIQLDQYETCFVDCSGDSPWYTDPCMADCEDEFDAYMDKIIEAQTAAAEGRLGDAIALGEEAEELYGYYEDCIDGCS